jgi:tRNA splicing endonuclease
MKLETARKNLMEDARFLGLSFADLIEFIESAPLAQTQRTLKAYRVYRDLGYK